jgi:hypothetical protein
MHDMFNLDIVPCIDTGFKELDWEFFLKTGYAPNTSPIFYGQYVLPHVGAQ